MKIVVSKRTVHGDPVERNVNQQKEAEFNRNCVK